MSTTLKQQLEVRFQQNLRSTEVTLWGLIRTARLDWGGLGGVFFWKISGFFLFSSHNLDLMLKKFFRPMRVTSQMFVATIEIIIRRSPG